MCLIAFALNSHPDFPLILVANRDEFYDRDTQSLHKWESEKIYAGKDLQAGGTWMGIHENGRFAAITNYRDLKNIKAEAKSRGTIPTGFLKDSNTAQTYFEELKSSSSDFNGYNFLGYEDGQMLHFSNYEGKINVLDKGVFGLSNALLDTPWPKVEKLKQEFTLMITSEFDHSDLLSLLVDGELAPENDLPDTGVTKDLEKSLSAICIRMEKYGTCSSAVVTIDHQGEAVFTERSYPVGARKSEVITQKFQIK